MQLSLFAQPTEESETTTKKAEWDKFYTVYMFDFTRYHKLCKDYPNTDRNKLRKQCYILDDDGQRIHLGDCKHIYRYKALCSIRQELARYAENTLNPFSLSDISRTHYYTLTYERYTEDKYTHTDILTGKSGIYNGQKFNLLELEINDTWQLPIKTRLLLHLEVLRLCRKGESIENACKSVLETVTI